MILSKSRFFLILVLLVAIPFLFYKMNWLLHSQKTSGTMSFKGKSITGQLVHEYSVLFFKVGKDTVWFDGNDNIFFKEGESVPVRYQINDPQDARIDALIPIWGDVLVYGGIPILILLVIFLHPQIIPLGSTVKLSTIKPFIQIV
ncbi:MAG: hypothetical protein ACKVOW_03070 [Chitinophagaceae bacterium]